MKRAKQIKGTIIEKSELGSGNAVDEFAASLFRGSDAEDSDETNDDHDGQEAIRSSFFFTPASPPTTNNADCLKDTKWSRSESAVATGAALG